MKNLRIGLAQLNVTVGDLEGNAAAILQAARTLVEQGAGVVLFPEMALCGYPPEDLMMKAHFVEDCERHVKRLAEELPQEAVCVIGTPVAAEWASDPNAPMRRPYNAAVVIAGGKVAACYRKVKLPNYAIFDERRVFEAGERPMCLQVGGARLGIHVCEDSWGEPSLGGEELDLNLLINLSASPYHQNKLSDRYDVLGETARSHTSFLAYVNLVGGQDELVFDGGSFVMDPQGNVVAQARQFEEDLLIVDIPILEQTRLLDEPREIEPEWVFLESRDQELEEVESAPARMEPLLEPMAEVYEALKLGLRDYVNKNGFKEVVIAISGGIDSALVAMIAVDALGSDRVKGVTMPSQYSSAETLGDAGELARNLDIELKTIPIKGLFEQMVGELAPHWNPEPGLAEENIQARIRGNLIMALSNKMGYLVLTTGNKSELATGYCTLYGDMAGGFAVIKDVPKLLVFALCRWRNEQAGRELVPQTTIDRPPSAELRPDQKDSDSLPDYDVLDPILEAYVEQDQSLESIVALGYDEAEVRRIMRLVDLAEYKRRQAPPGIRVTSKAFGRDRRLPVTNNYRN